MRSGFVYAGVQVLRVKSSLHSNKKDRPLAGSATENGINAGNDFQEKSYILVTRVNIGRSFQNSQALAKRIIDIVISASALALLLPAFVILIFAIRLESRGPAIFTQYRWGRNSKPFRVYKFRSMAATVEDSGLRQAVRSDTRVTRLGAVLRRTNIDELPQLLNVLKGDMSLVGPRCHPIEMLAGGIPYEDLVPDYHRRHAVRPGLTGLAQVHGLRGPTTDATAAIARVKHDLEYIREFSIWLDFKIIARTLSNELRAGGTGF